MPSKKSTVCAMRMKNEELKKVEWVYGSFNDWVRTCYEREFGGKPKTVTVITKKSKKDFEVSDDDF